MSPMPPRTCIFLQSLKPTINYLTKAQLRMVKDALKVRLLFCYIIHLYVFLDIWVFDSEFMCGDGATCKRPRLLAFQ
jgi:hypothetical protein